MRSLLNMLKKNEYAFSIGRVCALIGFLLWVFVTLWLVLLGKGWIHYDTLCVCSFSFLLIQLCNKALESKLFSVKQVIDDATGNPSKQTTTNGIRNG